MPVAAALIDLAVSRLPERQLVGFSHAKGYVNRQKTKIYNLAQKTEIRACEPSYLRGCQLS